MCAIAANIGIDSKEEETKYPCKYCGKLKAGIRSYDNKPFDLCPDCNNLLKLNKIVKCKHCEKYTDTFLSASEEKSDTDEPCITDIRQNWETPYRCNDGHYVRSKGELLIDNWLYSNNIVHCYEKIVSAQFKPDEKLYCDFYIPSRNLYIEYWGKDDEEYMKRRSKKEELYRENNISYISIEESDMKNLEDTLYFELNRDRRRK